LAGVAVGHFGAIMSAPSVLPEHLAESQEVGPPRQWLWVRRLNLVLAILWAVMIPISVMTGWIFSIAFIAAASIYANFVSHLAAWRADVPNTKTDT
jgi:hypothetical protein